MAVLTQGNGVELAFHLQRALVAFESINHLLELSVANQQVLCSLLVLLQENIGTR